MQVGDFGFWPHYHNTTAFSGGRTKWNQYGIKNKVDGIKDDHVKIYWCPGNHENLDILDELEASTIDNKFIETMPSVYFATFGSILTLLDGTNVMFCGKADSIDKNSRIPGDSWWAQETISLKDMCKLPNPETTNVDWLISHTCPTSFDLGKLGYGNKKNDPSHENLEWILNNFKPRKWWFGHYHNHILGKVRTDRLLCEWMLLDRIDNLYGKKWCHQISITK